MMFNKRAQEIILKTALVCSVSGAGYLVGAQIEPQNSIVYAQTVYKTTVTTSMRRGMRNDETLIVKIPSRQAVDILSVYQNGAWAKVRWNNRTGYIRTMYLTKAQSSGSSAAASPKSGSSVRSDGYHMFTAESVTLRTSASSSSEKLTVLKPGTDFLLIDRKGSYYKIYVNKRYGWIPVSSARDYSKTGN